MLKVEKNAKNLDEALELAAKDLGVSKDEVSYTVTKEIGKGLMKFLLGGSEIEITAWRTADEEKESSAKSVAKPEKPVKKADKKEMPAVEKAATPEKKPTQMIDDDFVIPKTAVDDAKYFVSELLTKIGLTFELHVKLDKNVISIDVSGEKMGLLIGKRGDTLDAVQMLTVLYVNRTKNMPYVKVSIDTEGYRSKREATLVRLAHGLERSVLRDKKSITLEPMTANERRIIHSALQNNPKIKTHSIGEEPNRRMVVSLVKADEE
ncbi:MAG: KH domain-containing protein [Clostridia bacterium]|nr:KH domain-containing protein [Clostridia bacterium]